MAFTEFCCRSGGSNLNAGTKAGDSTEPGTGAAYTSTNGNWDGTSVFIPTDGSTPASTIAAGDFASVFLDAATVTVYIARIASVGAGVNGIITLSTTAKSGTAPAVGVTGRTLIVGGAWKGPNAAESFPFNLIAATLTNSAIDFPRVNFKNDAQYNITAAMTHSVAGPIRFQGYTSTFGDLGKATIDGGTSGASYTMLSGSGTDCEYVDLIFANNGATGNQNGANLTGARHLGLRLVVHDVLGNGILSSAAGGNLRECEAHLCNKSNTASMGGIRIDQGTHQRCISHDNAGSNNNGYVLANAFSSLEFCISDTNGLSGYSILNGVLGGRFLNCDAYSNGGNGILNANSAAVSLTIAENCNFIKNGLYGISFTGTSAKHGIISNCGFGAGTQANSSGATNLQSCIEELGSIVYAANITPWVDPVNGDFRINLAAAINAGRGTFTETAASYAGTVGYPNIGAAPANPPVARSAFPGMGIQRASSY